ncbi:N-acetyltransferase family protein [Streptomyces sp. CA-249302]|uniref:GNAT family N-acetyltransferase n=1 Tax=Streptomyces sp. CA-249302 TaxID=3240058 RepID=UPI003D8D4122
MDTVMITRVAEDRWEAVADDRIVGRGDVSQRPDGRRFISVDAWQDAVFDRLAATMLTQLPEPLHTLVGEADHDLKSSWERLGFTVGRREWEYVLPTRSYETGLGGRQLPPGSVTILPAGEADADLLRTLDRTIRAEVEATVGWHTMPAEVLPRPAGCTPADPSKYATAVRGGEYVGLIRVARVRRRARIGLIAIRNDERRHGIGRALLTHALDALHREGIDSAWAEVDVSNAAAIALAEGVGARRSGSCLELVRR